MNVTGKRETNTGIFSGEIKRFPFRFCNGHNFGFTAFFRQSDTHLGGRQQTVTLEDDADKIFVWFFG